MANEYVNKVIYGGKTILDLTADTVAEDQLLKGVTAHDKSGKLIKGTCTFDSDTSDATATAGEILNGKTAYIGGAKVTGTMSNRGSQVSNIKQVAEKVTIQNGFHDGSGYVQISADEQAKIIPANILSGVTILGVVGSSKPASDIQIEPAKSVIPSTVAQQITPSEGYDVMAQVNIAAIPYSEVLNAAGGLTVTIG